MREDIKIKKYKMIYKKINDHYCNEYMNVKKSCEKEGITPSKYYKICKELGKKSVGTETKKKEKVTKKGIKEDDNRIEKNEIEHEKMNNQIKTQKGGEKKYNNNIEKKIGNNERNPEAVARFKGEIDKIIK